ncbi:MAG: hypothetical protein ACRC9N_12055 [Aeromonas sp.]
MSHNHMNIQLWAAQFGLDVNDPCTLQILAFGWHFVGDSLLACPLVEQWIDEANDVPASLCQPGIQLSHERHIQGEGVSWKSRLLVPVTLATPQLITEITEWASQMNQMATHGAKADPLLMNPFSGHVAPTSDWLADLGVNGMQAATLIEVCRDADGHWQEVKL